MSYQAQTWVDKVGIHQCKNGGELLVLIRVANHTNGEMRGCYASAETLAGECLMGESTVLKHLRRLKAGGVLVPGDPELVSHLRADRRPPVYDLAGGHDTGCPGKHSSDVSCETATTGARSEHPSKQTPATGVQIDLPRVFKSSTNSCKELNSLFSLPAGAFSSRQPHPSQERERETATPEGVVPEPRSEQPEAEVRPAVRVARRWAAERQARGVFTSPDRVAALAKEADALLAKGQSVECLEREVSVMADHPTWVSLVRHMESVRPVMAAASGRGVRPRGPGEGLSAAARAILAQGSGL